MKHQHLKKVIIKSDDKYVVDCLHSEVPNISEFGSIIQCCRHLLRQCDEVKVVFAPKTANIAAHVLAQNARSFFSTQFSHSPPNCIAQNLALDVIPCY